jgi:hypothetical protein
MAKITRTRTFETSIARIIIGASGSLAVEWQLVDETDKTIDEETVGREVAEQPAEIQAAVAAIMAYAATVTDDAATTKQATVDAEIAAAVAAKGG